MLANSNYQIHQYLHGRGHQDALWVQLNMDFTEPVQVDHKSDTQSGRDLLEKIDNYANFAIPQSADMVLLKHPKVQDLVNCQDHIKH